MAAGTDKISRITVFGYVCLSTISLLIGICILRDTISAVEVLVLPFAVAFGIIFLLGGFIEYKYNDYAHSAAFMAIGCMLIWAVLAFLISHGKFNEGMVLSISLLLALLIPVISMCIGNKSYKLFTLLSVLCGGIFLLMFLIGVEITGDVAPVLISLWWFAEAIMAIAFCFVPEFDLGFLKRKEAPPAAPGLPNA